MADQRPCDDPGNFQFPGGRPIDPNEIQDVKSYSKRRPRWMPLVEIELVEKVNVRSGNTLSQNDIMEQIFSSGKMTTMNKGEYDALNESKQEPSVPEGMKDIPKPKIRKWYITQSETGDTSLVTLGHNMIIRPYVDKVSTDLVKDVNVITYNRAVKASQGAYKTTGISAPGLFFFGTTLPAPLPIKFLLTKELANSMKNKPLIFKSGNAAAGAIQSATNTKVTSGKIVGQSDTTITVDHGPGSVIKNEVIKKSDIISMVGPDRMENTRNTYTDKTDDYNSWVPFILDQGVFSEVGSKDVVGTRILRNYINDRFVSGISSVFTLRKNQPFVMPLKLFPPSSLVRSSLDDWWNQQDKEKSSLSTFIPKNQRKDTCAIIRWGSGAFKTMEFALVIFRNKNVALYKRSFSETSESEWFCVGELKLATEKDLEHDGLDLVIYPIQSQLFLFDASDIPASPSSIKHSSFILDEPIQLNESGITVMFYGGRAMFGFNKLLHERRGSIKCPKLNVPWKPTVCVNLGIDYVGKVGFSNDLSKVVFKECKMEDIKVGDKVKVKLSTKVNEFGVQTNDPNSGGDEFDGGVTKRAIAGMDGGTSGTADEDYFVITNSANGNPQAIIRKHIQLMSRASKYSSTGNCIGIGFPHKNDKNKIYSYLNGYVSITGCLPNKPEDEEQYYEVDLISGVSDNITRDRIYSPAVRAINLEVVPGDQVVDLQVNPKIKSSDILSLNIKNGVQGSSATISLNNRKFAEDMAVPNFGRYTWYPGYSVNGKPSTFTGVKPVKIRCGWIGEPLAFGEEPKSKEFNHMDRSSIKSLAQHFYGYVTKRDYDRRSPQSSTVSLACEDRSKLLKESYAMNLPIYDGWCHLAVIHNLAREYGLTDDEILLDQDMLKSDNKIRLVDLIQGDPDTKQGPCYDGHVNGFPEDAKIGNREFGSQTNYQIKGHYLHMTMPSSILTMDCNYKFQFGKSIWECMEEIRKYSGFYLYCNHFGNLVYGPPVLVIQRGKRTKINVQENSYGKFEVASSQDDMVFKEVDLVENFNEFQRNLTGSYDTSEMRNSLTVIGLNMNSTKDGVPLWIPQIVTKRQEKWPNNPDAPSYYPWLRWILIRNMRWNDYERNVLNTEEIFRRAQRNKANASFGAWGQPELFPFMTLKIDESQARETGLDVAFGDCTSYIVNEINHNIEPQKWETEVNAEIFDEKAVNYEPTLW
jgi:hypothetical protein